LVLTLQFLVVGILDIEKVGINKFFLDHYSFGVIYFFGLSLATIWLLTCTFLPVIRINQEGISAYSIFWTRHFKWEEIQSFHLVKLSTKASGRSSYSRTSVTFEKTSKPETKSIAFLNKGVRVNTFIFISKNKVINPKNISLGVQLTSHRKITLKQELAFEYEKKAWEIIQIGLGKKAD